MQLSHVVTLALLDSRAANGGLQVRRWRLSVSNRSMVSAGGAVRSLVQRRLRGQKERVVRGIKTL